MTFDSIARKDLEKMMKLRYSLKDIQQSLEDLYSNPMKNTIGKHIFYL